MNELKILNSEDGKYRCYKIAVKGRGKDKKIKEYIMVLDNIANNLFPQESLLYKLC